MREYQTNSFKITFNGDLVSVDVDWEELTKYIVEKYSVTKHYVHKEETFFEFNMCNCDLDEICDDMDYFNDIVDLSVEDMTKKITSLLAISPTAVRKNIHDYLGQTKRNVPDAGNSKQPDIQKEQAADPKPARTDNSIF